MAVATGSASMDCDGLASMDCAWAHGCTLFVRRHAVSRSSVELTELERDFLRSLLAGP